MPKPSPEDYASAVNLTPAKAIEYLQSKGLKVTWSWKDVADDAAQQSFVVAKSMKMDILQSIKDEVDAAVASGETFASFQKNLMPTMEAKGWWGKKIVNGETVQLGSPHRLKTIYDTNMQSAYNAGRYRDQIENAEDRPFWRLRAVLDGSTRETHAQMDGYTARYDDPVWDRIYPPNGYNCREYVDALTAEEAAYAGPNPSIPSNYPDPGFASNPGKAPWRPSPGDYDPEVIDAAGGLDD